MEKASHIAAIMIVCLVAAEASGQPLRASNRKLLDWRSRTKATNLQANTVRSQAATSQAILEAVESGASGYNTRRAGYVGNTMAWAAAQGDQGVFNYAERVSGPGGKKK